MNRKQSIRRSMLWSAYCDALGFITELASPSMVRRRVGQEFVERLTPWARRLGGRWGVDIQLPQGCYSDDTQLRLATSRALRGDGSFDVEAFAKVELPVWRGYALGAGRGTKAAAEALAKANSHWCTNFFKTQAVDYMQCGGNGAAMRIQPHVWVSGAGADDSTYLRDVVRNAIITHGHPRGIIGACFHAMCLHAAMGTGEIPRAAAWTGITHRLRDVTSLVHSDHELAAIWLQQWEVRRRQRIGLAMDEAINELASDIQVLGQMASTGGSSRADVYAGAVERLGALSPSQLGSGIKTALLAAFAAAEFAGDPRRGAAAVVNVLGSDTDSIATMAGALWGAVCSNDPAEPVADSAYLESEAARLCAIAEGKQAPSFDYPDLVVWQAPGTQLDIVGKREGRWAVTGLGDAEPVGEYQEQLGSSPALWQWFKLSFGQTILTKRRHHSQQLESRAEPATSSTVDVPVKQNSNPKQTEGLFATSLEIDAPTRSTAPSLDEATDRAIKSNFDSAVVGDLLLQLSQEANGVDAAVAYAAIVAKARRARLKRFSNH